MNNRVWVSACFGLVCALLLTVAPANAGRGAGGEAFVWQAELVAGQVIEIHGINGDVRATGSEGREVVVSATKSGRGDHDAVTIEVTEHANGVTICAVYPGARNSACKPGEGSSSSASNVMGCFILSFSIDQYI